MTAIASSGSAWPRWRPAAYALLALGAVIMPVVLWVLDLPLILYSWGKYYQVFELFGFCAAIALITLGLVELRHYSGTAIQKALLIVLPFGVMLHYLSFLSDYSARSGDYLCYEAAAKAVLEGANPYGQCYFYPPLMAQILAGAYRVGEWVARLARCDVQPMNIWYMIFYAYQCAQFYLLALAYLLSYRLLRRLAVSNLRASVLVAVLLIFNNSVVRTLRHNQVNLWVLDAVLLGILLLETHPVWAGLAVALAGHVKLYPLALLGPWVLNKRWRAVLAAGIGIAAIALVQTGFGRDWSLWQQYLASPFSDPKVIAFRNSSLQSVLFNTFRALRYIIHRDLTGSMLLTVLQLAATAGVAGWFLLRFAQRERLVPEVERAAATRQGGRSARTYRDLGHALDILAFSLIISPSVWVHQYVLALPVALWAAAIRGSDIPWRVGVGVFLMFAIPVFDVFPLSYHRLVGLVMLLALTTPRIVAERWTEPLAESERV